eukprot:TRINITY_DN3990_c0_g1_i1.p1 TRINITY_DN3990_c0_g1~~TRINITY_DN3990_c0_g1_i1.p1  ORF type:complete len:504 (-),score=148.77 TRINITY_DN3990_c0_g1_i1:38-1549(-)
MTSLQPAQILADGASEEKGEQARMSNYVGAIALCDLIKTTLGPKGMDKILQSTGRDAEVTVTNDGATILKSIMLDNPAAKLLVEISKVQDDEVGDGTTSVCVLAGELLREAEKATESGIHPQVVIKGWRQASAIALSSLASFAIDHKSSPEQYRADLLQIAKTTLSSKILNADLDKFANLAVDSVLRLKGSTDLSAIHIIKKRGGSLRDSFLDSGFILEKKFGIGQPKTISNAKVLIANTAMDNDKIKIFGSRVKSESSEVVANIEKAERDKMIAKCNKIKATGCNVFINRQLIYNLPENFFTDNNIISIEHSDFDGMERLALVLGAEITSTFDHPELIQLGACDKIEEIFLGEDKAIKFSGVQLGEACTIVLRGPTKHLLDEAERAMHDAISVISQTVGESKIIYGGGCAENKMAAQVEKRSREVGGKEGSVMEGFGRALRKIPMYIAANGGLDGEEIVGEMRRREEKKEEGWWGVDVVSGGVGDMKERGFTFISHNPFFKV